MRALFLTSLLLAWTCAPFAPAQQESGRTISFEGAEVFCHILHHSDLQPIQSIEARMIDPRKSLIIILGQPDLLRKIRPAGMALREFLDRGGSLFVATDYPGNLSPLPVLIPEKKVTIQPDWDFLGRGGKWISELAYHGDPECPLLPCQHSDHPIFRLLSKKIATNRPSSIILVDGWPMKRLLTFPQNGENYMVGSSRDASSAGRVLVIAGHGMFMNGMMLQQDNDNFAFTVNAIRWLREGPDDTKRSHALFIFDGEIITDFDVKLTRPAPLPRPPVRLINRLLFGLQKELMNAYGERLIPLLVALVTLGLLLYGTKKFMEGRYLPETTVPLTVGSHASRGSAEPLVEQRHRALLRKNNLWEEARCLVHEWFREQFGITPQQWGPGFAAELHVEDIARSDRVLHRLADYITQLARAEQPVRVGRYDFVSLLRSLPLLTQAIKEQRLTLQVEGKKVRQSQGSTVG